MFLIMELLNILYFYYIFTIFTYFYIEEDNLYDSYSQLIFFYVKI